MGQMTATQYRDQLLEHLKNETRLIKEEISNIEKDMNQPDKRKADSWNDAFSRLYQNQKILRHVTMNVVPTE